MKRKRSFGMFLVYIALLVCLSPVSIFSYKHPAYNFDMLGYMALVVRMDQTTDLAQVHAITYEKAKETVPAEVYEELTGKPAFRKKFAEDPAQFARILPIYSVKPLYVRLCWMFYKMGFSLPRATVMPSIISFVIIGVFFFSWLLKYFKTVVAFLSSLLVMYSMFTVAIAGHSTPDCLSALLFFVSTYFILEKPDLVWMFLFFLLSIFARVDNVISSFFIISFLCFYPKWKRISLKQFLLMTVILGIIYLCAILPVTHFGWSIFYYAQYSKHIDYSRDFDQAISFSSWISFVFSKLVTAIVSTQFTFFMFISLLVLATPAARPRMLSFDQAFLLVLLFTILFRFLLLPDLSDRFYLGYYFVILILLIRRFYDNKLIVLAA